MELVLLKGAFVPFAVLEVLCSLAVEHAVVPVPLVLSVPALTVKNAPTALNAVSELAFVPTSIAPPESTTTVTFASLELALVNVAFLASPVVNASALLLIEAELAQVKISSRKVKLPLAF